MKWTTDMPTASGIYWTRDSAEDEPFLVEVHVGLPPLALAVNYFGTDDSGQIESYQGDWWYGPITAPSDSPMTSELMTAQMEARRLRNALKDVVKGMRSRAEPVGPLSGLWDDIFEYEVLIDGRGDTRFDWDGDDGPKHRSSLPAIIRAGQKSS